uniref:ELM2 domain-containing protein n=1 Tax=Ascaris lumbricoides TaxID=6252 RepID=A0A0M3HRJ6_ASCLU
MSLSGLDEKKFIPLDGREIACCRHGTHCQNEKRISEVNCAEHRQSDNTTHSRSRGSPISCTTTHTFFEPVENCFPLLHIKHEDLVGEHSSDTIDYRDGERTSPAPSSEDICSDEDDPKAYSATGMGFLVGPYCKENGEGKVTRRLPWQSADEMSYAPSINSARHFYIGATTPKKAEDYVHECTSFRIYHALHESIEDSLQKMQIGAHESIQAALQFHYKIVDVSSNPSERMFTVDYGDPHSPRFISLYSLARYYSVYASLHSDCDDGALQADIFPCWIKSAHGNNRRRHAFAS